MWCGAVNSSKTSHADAFLTHSENESLVIFAKFASEEAQLDVIAKSRQMTNFVLMASVSDVSLSSQSVSFDGKSKILAHLLEVLVGEDDVEIRPQYYVFLRASLKETRRRVEILISQLRTLQLLFELWRKF